MLLCGRLYSLKGLPKSMFFKREMWGVGERQIQKKPSVSFLSAPIHHLAQSSLEEKSIYKREEVVLLL